MACGLEVATFFGALFFGVAFFATAFSPTDLPVPVFFFATVLVVAAFLAGGFRVEAFLVAAFLVVTFLVPELFLAAVAFLRVGDLPVLALLEFEPLLAAGRVVVFFAFLPVVDFRLVAFFANVLSTFQAAAGYPSRFAY